MAALPLPNNESATLDGCESSHFAIEIKLVADLPAHGLADDLAPKDGVAGNGCLIALQRFLSVVVTP